MPTWGVGLEEKRCRADFRRPGNETPNLGLRQDDENQRIIDFCNVQPPKTIVHSFILLNPSSPPKYGG